LILSGQAQIASSGLILLFKTLMAIIMRASASYPYSAVIFRLLKQRTILQAAGHVRDI
jgi:hypothetical protein